MLNELNDLKAKLAEACNLLAVMHRDGGHHTAEVGFVQSCKDAERVRHDLLAEVERLRAERAIIDKVLKESNLDATRWIMREALRGGGECRHGGRQAGETPCPDCRGDGE